MLLTAENVIPIRSVAREGATLNAEADHRIGNNLALIAAMIRLQAGEVSRRKGPVPVGEVRDMLAEIAARIEAVGRLHRRLSGSAGSASVDVGEYLRELTTSIIDSVGRPGSASTTFDLHQSCSLHANQVLPLGLIVGELVSNALKYAHPAGLPTALVVKCERRADGLNIEINDDGVGLPEGFDAQTSGGLGFRLMRSLSQQLSAKLSFVSAPLGLRVSLAIPTQLAVLSPDASRHA